MSVDAVESSDWGAGFRPWARNAMESQARASDDLVVWCIALAKSSAPENSLGSRPCNPSKAKPVLSGLDRKSYDWLIGVPAFQPPSEHRRLSTMISPSWIRLSKWKDR